MAKKKTNLVKVETKDDIMELISRPATVIVETLTGILSSGRPELISSSGRIVQSIVKNTTLQQLGREFEYFQRKGRIKEDYFATNKNQVTLIELLKFIDEETPDEERLKAMKSIFLASVSNEATENDEIMAFELIKICRTLSTKAIIVLKTAFNVTEDEKSKVNKNSVNRSEWMHNIAINSDSINPDLVELAETELIEVKLISSNTLPDANTFNHTDHYRLTELGYILCQFITKFNTDEVM